ncbi:MAG: hypothetical protein KAU49_05540 [Candidatus Krumholzibacteria bacterium]|nr:hypothetical protein [Candidatus Krumholzibacteria bacterium]
MNRYSRREFLEISFAAAAGAALLPLPGCGSSSEYEGVLEVPDGGYPIIEVSGSHYEIGRQIGAAMKKRITGYLRYADDYRNSVDYLEGEGTEILGRMLSHARASFPHLVEELEGMAESLEIPFMRLFAFNCRSEIRMLQDPPGCSTIALKDGNQAILVHNEDGNDLNIGRMFLARITPPSGTVFLAFIYPGLLPGNGPGLNQNGIVQTTNYIQPRRVADGIPRYFISRAIFEAKSLEQAVSLATMEPRAFPFHHNLVSLGDRRILSVETAAWPEHRHDIMEVEGFYIHTNHFLHPAMVEGGETGERPFDVPYISSTTRMEVLNQAVENGGEPSDVSGILGLLSLHEGRPYSPCRHPEGDVRGVTLGTAVFQSPEKSMTLFHGNPCLGLKREHSL